MASLRRHQAALPLRSPFAADKYGPRRLETLYEISKILTYLVDTGEKTVLPLLAVLTKALPLRSAILIEKTAGQPKTIVWHAPDISTRDLKSAEARAMKSFAYLTGTAPPFQPAEAVTADRAQPGRFITAPLIIQGQGVLGVLHLEGVALFDEADVQFVSAIADQLAITLERYHARLRERKLNDDLEIRIAQRTAQLQDTIKELHAFTYSIAHDLRAPLRHIHGFSQLLVSGNDEKACNKYAQRIMKASEGMDTLIKDLLSYSRLTLEQVECAPVSLSSVLARIKTNMAEDLQQSRAQLTIEEPMPDVVGHELSLIQAISNLISNGLKFMAAGALPRIRVSAELRGQRVRLWVSDNGIGIAPEYQERIFGVFQRLHKAEDYPGTGIGLAIVRRALERMKGSAGVESQPGQGSRFWIELASVKADR